MDVCIKTYSLNVTSVTSYGSVNIGSTLNIQYAGKRDRKKPAPPEPSPPEQEPIPTPETPVIPGFPQPIPPSSSQLLDREKRHRGKPSATGSFYAIPTPVHPPLSIPPTPPIPRWD